MTTPSGEPAAVFAALAQLIYARDEPAAMYRAITDAAVDLVPACDHASLSLMVKGEFDTVAASDDVARHIDDLEREIGAGPCLDAIVDGAYQHDSDIEVSSQWPALAARVVAETPVRGMVGHRLLVDDKKVGALNVFSDRPGALSVGSADTGAVLAAFASVALVAAANHERAEQLQRGLESNREIGQAIGLLMAAHDISSDAAFAVLRRTSSELNLKLADIARRVVADRHGGRSGTLP